MRETFSGHAEFDIVLEAASADRGDLVWQAVLTLVLMNPKKSKGGQGGGGKKVRAVGCRGRGGGAAVRWRVGVVGLGCCVAVVLVL